jgi:hypothetical protein
MKDLKQFLCERAGISINEGMDTYLELDMGPGSYGSQVITLRDERDNLIKFDTNKLRKILQHCRGWRNKDVQDFIDEVVATFPKVDTINIERVDNNDENEVVKYIWIPEREKGWQDVRDLLRRAAENSIDV